MYLSGKTIQSIISNCNFYCFAFKSMFPQSCSYTFCQCYLNDPDIQIIFQISRCCSAIPIDFTGASYPSLQTGSSSQPFAPIIHFLFFQNDSLTTFRLIPQVARLSGFQVFAISYLSVFRHKANLTLEAAISCLYNFLD